MKINNVYKTYDTSTGKKVHALKGVSFDLPSTGVVVILGKSGSGKSTLLNILSGLDSFDSGDIEAFGKNMKDFSRTELDHYRNSCVGFVFQEYHLIPELSVGDNIALALELQDEKSVGGRVKSVLAQVDLVGYENRKIDELSGGQKQRVAIARALIKNPKIIFADEPTGALDSQTGESILQILKEISKEKLVILVTHDREFAERFGDRIIELADGKIIHDTDKAYRLEEKENDIKISKPRLPIKTALKIGCSNFKHHPFRLFSTILLSVIAFSLLGIALTIAFLNPTEVYSDAIMDSDIEFAAIYKQQRYKDPNEIDHSLDQFLGAETRHSKDVFITKEDIEYLQSQVGNSYTLVYSTMVNAFQKNIVATTNQITGAFNQNPHENFLPHADGYVALSEEECNRLGYTVIGELPKNSSEIAINECIFNVFTIAGILDGSQIYEINTYDDIIEHTITVNDDFGHQSNKTITGVVITGCDRECRNYHYAPTDRRNGNWETYHDKIFVCEDYFDEYTYALCSIPKNKSELMQVIDFILNYETNDGYCFALVNKLSFGFASSYYTASLLKMLCVYLSIMFLCFALLLLSNFIFTLMRRQMKQIGILSALGAGFKDLGKVYGSAIAVICSVVASISLAIQICSVKWLNVYLRNDISDLYFDLIPFNFLATLLLLAVIATVAIAGCFIPLIRLRKIDPTKIINKGQVK